MLRLFPRVAQISTPSSHLGAPRLRYSTMAQRRISKTTTASVTATRSQTANPALFVCDLQEKFRPAIFEFDKVVATTQKLLRASQILRIPVFATTQNAARLGATVPELMLDHPAGIKTAVHADKTRFSMLTPEVRSGIAALNSRLSCAIVGIESHICVTQTALDLLAEGHNVYIIADGVSSVNPEEVPIALARLRTTGAAVVTSEGWLYELMGDANIAEFRDVIKLVKESAESTRESLQALCKI